MKHYILVGEEIKEVDLMAWVRWFETDSRIVEQTKIGRVMVSTVFLGIDHNWANFIGDQERGKPLLFETMVFGGKNDQEQERYSTYAEAKAGHSRWVKKVKKRSF